MRPSLLALLLVVAVPAAAQSTHISGHVHVSGDTARPVADAEVALLPGGRSVRSDSGGAFRFSDVAAGSYTVRVRHIGFDVATLDVTSDGQHVADVRIALRAGAQVLSEVTVSGHRILFPARYAEAYERVANAHGAFFTTEQIDSLKPYDMKSLLQRLPGVLVNDRGLTFQRCQSGLVSNLGTGYSRVTQSRNPPKVPAHVQVYVDGVRMTRYGVGREDQIRDADEAIRDILPSTIQLVEIYTGVARIPGEYLDDACAVVLIWTKSGR